MNELHLSRSPYLQQHAQNPVHWRMWSEEAFKDAQSQNKPVIVSIGYATCHWCHVMEKESFEDQTIANFMNEHFICIKVDREEMPHVDQFYMDALQSMKQSGGWPLNMFVTPDKKPFYGGTYFPPQSMYNKPSWGQLLQYIYQHWTRENDDIFTQSETLTEHLENIQKSSVDTPLQDLKNIDWTWHKTVYTQHFDRQFGGWYTAPKFPQFLLLNNLVYNYQNTQDGEVLDLIRTFWDNIISNGLWDSTLGGVYRYAVDQQWRIPHFEKMLYDNALMIESLALSIQYTNMVELLPILKQQVEFVFDRMRDQQSGLFYSAFDADSEGVEGLYYMLNESEYHEFLSQNFVKHLYNVEKIFHGQNGYYKINLEALNIPLEDQESYLVIQEYLTKIRDNEKEHPLIDDKKILSLNALMNKALCVAWRIDFDSGLLLKIEQHFDDMLKHFKDGDQYSRICYDQYTISAQSEDIVFLMDAAINLALITGNEKYWNEGIDALKYAKNEFQISGIPYLSQVSINQNDIPVQRFERIDNILPSSNSVYASCLKILGLYKADMTLLEESMTLMRANVKEMVQYPQAYPQWWSHYNFVKSGGFIKVGGLIKTEILTRIHHKWGQNHAIMSNISSSKKQIENDEIFIQQCYEDRCTVLFKGNCKEFEKYC